MQTERDRRLAPVNSAMIAKMTRDFFLIACGMLILPTTPTSVMAAGITSFAAIAWALMILLGAVTSLTGVVLGNRPTEIIGCSFVGGGFTVWGAAAVLNAFNPMMVAASADDVQRLTAAFACILFAGAAGQAYRIISVRDGRL